MARAYSLDLRKKVINFTARGGEKKRSSQGF